MAGEAPCRSDWTVEAENIDRQEDTEGRCWTWEEALWGVFVCLVGYRLFVRQIRCINGIKFFPVQTENPTLGNGTSEDRKVNARDTKPYSQELVNSGFWSVGGHPWRQPEIICIDNKNLRFLASSFFVELDYYLAIRLIPVPAPAPSLLLIAFPSNTLVLAKSENLRPRRTHLFCLHQPPHWRREGEREGERETSSTLFP